MAKSKKKKINGIGLAIIPVIVAGVIAAHFLGIFTLDDWKKLLGYSDAPNLAEGTAQVHYIDVGQGDCSLVVSNGEALLIDTGEKENAQKICRYMKEQGVDSIKYMLLTHQHSDHMGAASEIIDSFDVENIIIPKLPDSMTPTAKFYEKFLKSVQKKGLKLTQAKPGEVYEIGECSLEILSPVKDYEDLNNFSAAAMLTHGEESFLFTGDIESDAEADIIKTGRLTEADVYKAGHHCSKTSNSKAFLAEVKPEYAVIMCGEDNSYHHPHKSALDRIKKYTGNIYRTDLDGTIVFTSDGEKLEVKTEKGE